MEIVTHIIEPKLDISRYFHGNNVCFLDIETTGLSRKYNQIYLIGLIYYNVEINNWNIVQLFANSLDKEKEVLDKLNDIIPSFDLIITYNGDSFDLPFIKYRNKYYKIENKILNIDSFDMYRKIRNNNAYLKLNNLKLKTVEESLGIYRDDKYSGKDCIDFYYQYINTKNVDLKESILKHNYDDLYYLLEIVEIFDIIQDIKTISVDLIKDKIYIQILDIIINGDIFSIICDTTPINQEIDIVFYNENFNLKWIDKTSLIIDLNVKEGLITPTKKSLYINKNDFSLGNRLKDLSQYMVPNNLMLLKVDNKFIMENIKSIINQLVIYIMR